MAEVAQNEPNGDHNWSIASDSLAMQNNNGLPSPAALAAETDGIASEPSPSYAAVLVGTSGLLLEGLARLLEGTDIHVVASAPSVDRLPSIDLQPHKGILLILDAGRDIEASLHQVRSFKALHEAGRIAVVQGTLQWPDVVSLFQAGVHACFPESAAAEIFLKSLELVMLGETFVPATLLPSMPLGGAPSPQVDNGEMRLSPQEERILGSLIEGQPNKVIARELGIADATVKIHIKGILRKLGVENRTQAAAWAMGRGSRQGPPPKLGSPERPVEANDPPSPAAEPAGPSKMVHEPTSTPGGLVGEGKKSEVRIEPSKRGVVNAVAESSCTQRWRLLPSERRLMEEQERRDEFLAKMHRLRELREARDASKREDQ